MQQQQASSSGDLAGVLTTLLRLGLGIGGLVSIAIGVWMIAAPRNFFELFPASVPDFGPYAPHFLVDLGGWNVAGGLLLLFALSNPARLAGIALTVNLVAQGVHAGNHVSNIMSGQVGPEHWAIDAPTVFLPVVILGVLMWISWKLQTGHIDADLNEQEEDLAEMH